MSTKITGLAAIDYAQHRAASAAVRLFCDDPATGPCQVAPNAAKRLPITANVYVEVDAGHVAHEMRRVFGVYGPDPSGVNISTVGDGPLAVVSVDTWDGPVVIDIAAALPVLAKMESGHSRGHADRGVRSALRKAGALVGFKSYTEKATGRMWFLTDRSRGDGLVEILSEAAGQTWQMTDRYLECFFLLKPDIDVAPPAERRTFVVTDVNSVHHRIVVTRDATHPKLQWRVTGHYAGCPNDTVVPGIGDAAYASAHTAAVLRAVYRGVEVESVREGVSVEDRLVRTGFKSDTVWQVAAVDDERGEITLRNEGSDDERNLSYAQFFDEIRLNTLRHERR